MLEYNNKLTGLIAIKLEVANLGRSLVMYGSDVSVCIPFFLNEEARLCSIKRTLSRFPIRVLSSYSPIAAK